MRTTPPSPSRSKGSTPSVYYGLAALLHLRLVAVQKHRGLYGRPQRRRHTHGSADNGDEPELLAIWITSPGEYPKQTFFLFCKSLWNYCHADISHFGFYFPCPRRVGVFLG